MCLILVAWRRSPGFPLVFAANRDEFHARPAAPMGWWEDRPDLLAGRDLRAGGTWLGMSRQGRFAAVTNYAGATSAAAVSSRGEIVPRLVASREEPAAGLAALDGKRYGGFSALAGDARSLAYGSNRGDAPRVLQAGLYVLGNTSLDASTPRLMRSREKLTDVLEARDPDLDALLDIVADTRPAGSAPFILDADFGTRCSTAIICRADGHIEVVERRFDPRGRTTGESRFVFVAPEWGDQPAP